MTPAPIRSSRPDHWTSPRPTPDPRKNGPLLPMQPAPRSLFAWLRKKVM